MSVQNVWITHASLPRQSYPLPYHDPQLSIETRQASLLIETLHWGAELHVHGTATGISVQIAHTLYELAVPAHWPLHVRTGDGNDKVTFTGLQTHVVIETQGGDDDVHLEGSSGPDRAGIAVVDAGPGDDLVVAEDLKEVEIEGGAGNDNISSNATHSSIYAGDGDDTVWIEGGRAIIEAMSGLNAVSNGPLDDRMYGHPGSINALGGRDAPLMFEAWNTPLPEDHAQTFQVRGDYRYVEKVTRQLKMLRATLTGSTLMEDLVARHARIVITHHPALDNAMAEFSHGQAAPRIASGMRGTPALNINVFYNPLTHITGAPSLIILYHELCHAWNFATGTLMGDTEQQAVGLDSGEPPFDFDDDPQTPATASNPYPFNENALRQELGLAARTHY
ncbi:MULTISPECIES: M91 family zinc metallopeptidase [Pseudomonas]|uniref:M91 family zinc metallopeptidase n=1 Tax=Pseudomonas TaxID=286 RepID=UPI002B40611A|nr:M91 family zinc metallopeptidase [Pseudomonas sichuanensis]